jgi:hypothetical protein
MQAPRKKWTLQKQRERGLVLLSSTIGALALESPLQRSPRKFHLKRLDEARLITQMFRLGDWKLSS